MANDYYLYMPCDKMILGHNMTLKEAQILKKELDAEHPTDAAQIEICKVSDDYKLAAEHAFTHLAKW